MKTRIVKFVNTVKYRWKVAPTWVKVLDISCWAVLILLLINFT